MMQRYIDEAFWRVNWLSSAYPNDNTYHSGIPRPVDTQVYQFKAPGI